MRLFRQVVFGLFAAAYLIICPLTILYAFGYSIRPGAERRLVKTGLIYLSTNPPGASVYLGRRRFTRATPAMLRGLLPGRYPVRITLKNHRPWEQVLPVEAEKATALEHILLLPAPLHPMLRLAGPWTTLVPMPGTRFLLLSQGPALGDWRIYDWKEEQMWPLVAGRSLWASSKVLAYVAEKNSPWVLFRVGAEGGERWLWIEIRRGETVIKDLTRLMLETPEAVAWDPHDHRHLFAVHDGMVDRLDAVEHTTSPKWLGPVRGFGVAGRAVYALGAQGAFIKMDRSGRDEETLAQLPLGAAPLLGRPSFFRIEPAGPGTVLLLGSRGELLTNRLPLQLAEGGVVGCEAAPRRQQAVVWTRQRVGLIRVPEELFEFEREAAPLRIRWIYEEGRQIDQAAWVDDGANLLVRDAGRVFVLETGAYGTPRVEPLVDAAEAPVALAEEAGAVYYLERGTGHLMALSLLPSREILPLPVLDEPEPRLR